RESDCDHARNVIARKSHLAMPWSRDALVVATSRTVSFFRSEASIPGEASRFPGLPPRTSPPARTLAHHLPRIFVVPQTKKNRLAQLQIARPLGELQLANQLRVGPGAFAHLAWCDALHPLPILFRRQIGKRTIVTELRAHPIM